ncbi:PQQ-dependent dehydrogenase, methanol/ethanol family [Altericroceibacterium endophyticum]|uniref:PQQ-dependent dehydrogenase, methanol/ethanol family n=1 Tax=Altericroceibacterium endophyticum TaxID=1808508 RepID=A0A6I4T8F6_9SPHN|nr:PQQ-dependent dehydrogenase, methanol/ethanol family [Altericroceibacterium endophyticum]MXO66150.1 PQQ-dependent dehydrogenase, methanol/ethanol family [Altericroceibacterium endophyticum]
MKGFAGRALTLAGLAMILPGCSAKSNETPATESDRPGNVTAERLLAADDDPDNWLGYGRTYDEQRYSPLTDINTTNVGELSLAWAVELDTNRGQEATPIVVDGIMYISTAWDKVLAVDAASGKVVWQHDPEVDGAKAVHACCDVVNRGVAVWEGKVFIGTIDGRLIALDAATGDEVWSRVTVDQEKPYTITGAPRVFKDKVIIGNSGAEMGVRGYVTAYDTDTGEEVWRFYTVPGNPADGPDNAASDAAFEKFAGKTWFGDYWEMGGGGTVWDSMVYDPEFDQIILGVGNGSPWNHRVRSDGKGDNLFLSSILALDPDTGAYKWHYQVNPAETWDFTATQQMTLADLTIDGKPRKVLMQAPKNGFFYVIDRSDGKLISAEPYVPQNWAEKIDIETGRPVEIPAARFADKPYTIYPSGLGGHAWMPMSYSPRTGLVYIPAMHAPLTLEDNQDYDRHPGRWNTGVNMIGAEPGREEELRSRGWLIAWDPVKQKAAWKVERDWPWNGGTLATAGDLVFQGDAKGFFHAYDARDGRELWKFQVERGIVAGPATYRVNGTQYVAVLAGYGGSMGMAVTTNWMRQPPPNGMLLAFKLGGKASLPALPPAHPRPYISSDESFSQAQLAEGGKWFGTFCVICHNGPVNPDLLRSPIATDAGAWRKVVMDGALSANGMASFADYLTPAQAEAIRAYVVTQARQQERE